MKIPFASKELIVDTNLLILYFVGNFKPSFIQKFKRTSKFDIDDFERVQNLIHYAKRVVVTPQILAEISNLSKDINEPYYSEYFILLIKELKLFLEKHIGMNKLITHTYLSKIGFADMSIYEAAKTHKFNVLTDDFELHSRLLRDGMSSVNLYELKGLDLF